ncbi:hypothetical protein ES705_07290 [subsurface metagenome]
MTAKGPILPGQTDLRFMNNPRTLKFGDRRDVVETKDRTRTFTIKKQEG